MIHSHANKALFLDRDGVINVENSYVFKIEDFIFISDVFEVCRYFIKKGYLIIIVTNQSGIARGIFTESQYDDLTHYLLEEFKAHGVIISKVYHCPHHPDQSISCNCRKPKPGMILKASEEFNIDLNQSILVGDKRSDVESGVRAGIKDNYLITTGHEIPMDDYLVPLIMSLSELKQHY